MTPVAYSSQWPTPIHAKKTPSGKNSRNGSLRQRETPAAGESKIPSAFSCSVIESIFNAFDSICESDGSRAVNFVSGLEMSRSRCFLTGEHVIFDYT